MTPPFVYSIGAVEDIRQLVSCYQRDCRDTAVVIHRIWYYQRFQVPRAGGLGTYKPLIVCVSAVPPTDYE